MRLRIEQRLLARLKEQSANGTVSAEEGSLCTLDLRQLPTPSV